MHPLPNAQIVNYKYDALGRRSERNVNTTTWTKFTYDGLDVMLDQNSDGTSISYLNGLGIDNKLRQTVNGQAQYFLNDHLGSTNALTDATGNVIASTNYDSFGNATNANIGTRYQFTGREFDSLTGLQYSRARFYSLDLGRFISEDPIGFKGGINQFGYVRNSPLGLRDPLGLKEDFSPFGTPGYSACLTGWTGLGAVGGFWAGGGVGALATAGTAGAGAPAIPAGAYGGAALGGAIGAGIGTLICGNPPPFPITTDIPTQPPPFPNQADKTCDAKPKPNATPLAFPLPFPRIGDYKRGQPRCIKQSEDEDSCFYICDIDGNGRWVPVTFQKSPKDMKCPFITAFPPNFY